MSYIITRSNGTTFEILDNEVVTTRGDLQLVGRNRANYGLSINQNFYRLLENFASQTEPPYPQIGQLWFNTDTHILSVRLGDSWKPINRNIYIERPVSPELGDFYFNVTTNQLEIAIGSGLAAGWNIIGPVGTTASGVMGFVAETVITNTGTNYVASIYVSGSRFAIYSKEDITGILTINGVNIATAGFPSHTLKTGLNFVENSLYFPNTGIYNSNITGTFCSMTGNITGGNIIANSKVLVGNISLRNDTIASSYGTLTIDPGADGASGNAIVAGNLQVTGSITSINSTTVEITGLNLKLAKDAGNATAANGAGITVAGANAQIFYNSTRNDWNLNKSANITGNAAISGTITSTNINSTV